MVLAYCVKDKATVVIRDPQRITMKNGRPASQGTCPICGGKVFRIGSGYQAAPDSTGTCPGCGAPDGWPHAAGCPRKRSPLK